MAIQTNKIFADSGDSKRFYIPKKLRFTLRFFEIILAMFCLFLLGLQDKALLAAHDLTSVTNIGWTAGIISIFVAVWHLCMYILPM
jgi:hypothetical protein